jgi:hypothetical protein
VGLFNLKTNMKRIKIGERDFKMYQDWNELPLGNFQNMAPLMSSSAMTPMNRLLITIENITEPALDKKTIESFSFEELSTVTEWAKWALDFTEIVGSWESREDNSMMFDIDGEKYAFDNTFQITVRQMLDLDHLTSERNTDEQTHNKWFGKAVDDRDLTDRKFWSNVHRIISILIRPVRKRNIFKRFFYKAVLKTLLLRTKQKTSYEYIKSITDYEVEKYDQSTVEERAKLFQERLSAADGAMLAFFLSGLKEQFQKTMRDFGREEETKTTETSQGNGAGLPRSESIATETS